MQYIFGPTGVNRRSCREMSVGCKPRDQSLVVGGNDKDGPADKNWRLFLNDSPLVPLFDGCGETVDFSPNRKFIISTVLWGDEPGLYQCSFADKKCTTLKPCVTTNLAMFADDGKSFLYALASHGETIIYRQPEKA